MLGNTGQVLDTAAAGRIINVYRHRRKIAMEYITLRSGVSMPMLGFGTFQIPGGDPCRQAVAAALAAG